MISSPLNFDVPTLLKQGLTFHQTGRLAHAEAVYRQVLKASPTHFEALRLLGSIQYQRGNYNEAIHQLELSLQIRPDHAPAHNSRGNVLNALGRVKEAMASYKRALTLKPDFAEAYYNLGEILSAQGFTDASLAHYDRALTHKPFLAGARFAACVGQLPILYMEEPEIIRRRAAYETHLEALCDEMDHGSIPEDSLASFRPFYLAYQGYNDKDLQSRYGSLVCRMMAKRYPPAALTKPPRPDEPVRVGIVSAFFRNHASFNITAKGWLSQLDRQRFRIFGYYTASQEDAETNTAANSCDVFIKGPLSIDAWRTQIEADALHVLIYPEIGMRGISATLAAQRLAPVQCSSWGHPETSGFPTIDYFLSSELMEPPDGDNHYTERLIRLPNLSTYLEPVAAPPISLNRSELGLRQSATVYWCGQSLCKYLPQFDHVFPSIAREVGDCQFCFIRFYKGEHVTALFQKRLARAFAAFGLRAADHCMIWPILEENRYIAAIGQCDIVLDSIGWSGCNTTLSTLTHDLPVVTMPGSLMRGRHSMAFLKMMGVTETIVESVSGYITTAVRLARDVPWRMAIKAKIANNKHRIYRDRHSILGLEEFLDGIGRGERM